MKMKIKWDYSSINVNLNFNNWILDNYNRSNGMSMYRYWTDNNKLKNQLYFGIELKSIFIVRAY